MAFIRSEARKLSRFSTLAAAFSAALYIGGLTSAHAAPPTANAPVCDLYSMIALNPGQQTLARQMGYRLMPVPEDTKKIPRTGFILRRQNTYIGLSRAYQIEGRVVFAHYDGVKFFGVKADPDPVRSIPTCVNAIKQSGRMNFDAHMRFYATSISKYASGGRDTLPLGLALLATEALQMNPKFSDSVRSYKQMSGEYKALLQQAIRLSELEPEAALDELRVLVTPRMKNYCGGRRTLTDFFKPGDPCGNCVSQTILLTALIWDAELKAPKGKWFAIEKFNDHVRPVLLGPTKNDLYDLVYGKSDDNFTGGMYRMSLMPYVRMKSLVTLYPEALRGFEGYASAKNRFHQLVVPGAGNGIVSGTLLVLSNLRLGLTPEVRFYRNLSWQEQTYDWGASTGTFGGSVPARAELDLSGRQSTPVKTPGLLSSLGSSVKGFFSKEPPGEPYYTDKFLNERFFSREEISNLRPMWKNQTSRAFRNYVQAILSADRYFGQPIPKKDGFNFFHPLEYVYQSHEANQLACAKLKGTPVTTIKHASREYDVIGDTPANPAKRFFDLCEKEKYHSVTFNGAPFYQLDRIENGSAPGVVTIHDQELYRQITSSPAAYRPRVLFKFIRDHAVDVIRSSEFQTWKQSRMGLLAGEKSPMVDALIDDVMAMTRMIDTYGSHLQIKQIDRNRSPLFNGWFLIGEYGNGAPRELMTELVQMNFRQSNQLEANRWKVIEQLNSRPGSAYDAVESVDRPELRKLISDFSLRKESERKRLNVFMPQGKYIDSLWDAMNILRPTRKMMVSLLFDPNFELSPPRDESERRLLALAKQRAQERKEARRKQNEVKPAPGGLEKPQPAQEEQRAQPEIKIQIVSERDLPQLPNLDRKLKPIKTAIFKFLLQAGLSDDSENPTIQFALLPLMTKKMTEVGGSLYDQFAFTPALLLPGAEISSPLTCIDRTTMTNCLKLTSRYMTELPKLQLPRGKTADSSFFRIHPVLEVGRAYYDEMPARYMVMKSIEGGTKLRAFQKFPSVLNAETYYKGSKTVQTPQLKIEKQPTNAYGETYLDSEISIPTAGSGRKSITLTRWILKSKTIERLTYGQTSTIPLVLGNEDNSILINPTPQTSPTPTP